MAMERAEPVHTPDNPLLALERLYTRFSAADAMVKAGGRIVEVSATQYRVRGLSRHACIGDVVEHHGERGRRSGEIVRID
ncbi:MAG: flagellum-specific ATP synthase FliI, partial [Mesorhizobium sp.]|nr:flagellum-specific ATP synthase FliI [Mesorhizobium sp.]